MLYKVVKEDGVVVDDVEFAKDEVLELESDALNVVQLLEEGSIVEVEEEEEPADPEPTDEEEMEHASGVIIDEAGV